MTTATKYKTYPKYKPSGIDWLGDIPDGWGVKRLKNIIEPLQSGGRESESINLNGGVLSIGGEHVGWNGEILLENPRYISREYYLQMNQGKIKENDVLLVKDGATIGKTALIDKLFLEDAAVNEHVFIIRADKKNTPKYLYYFIISKIGQEQIFLEMRGSAQPGLNSGFISKSFLFVPPKDGQKKITDFLDRETTKIDEMAAKKKKMMELLKEKRQALITRAVTKGLDPKAKMKPSGIDWLGDIPDGWESWKVAHLFNKIGSGTTPPSDDMDYYEGDIPWVITGELKDNEIFDSENKVTKKAIQELSALKIFPKDSLLIALYGATIGKMAILRIPATTNQACCVLGDSKLIDIYFSFYYFLSFRPHLIALSYGGGQPNISQDTIRSIRIFLPKIDEQKEIVSFLDRETLKINEMMKKVEAQIEKLQEYRQALITSAVTGKIKV